MFAGQRYWCLALDKINVREVSPSKQHYILGKLTMCAHRKENKCCESKREAPSLPLQFNSAGRFMHTILFVCRVGEREAYCMSSAIYQTLLCSLYWLSMSTRSERKKKKEPAEIFTQEEYKSLSEMRNILWCVKEERNIQPPALFIQPVVLQYSPINCRQYKYNCRQYCGNGQNRLALNMKMIPYSSEK